MEITKKQREEMEHALGLNYKKVPFRNKFYTYAEDESWQELIVKGLASVTKQRFGKEVHHFYYVTKRGQEFLGLRCECAELGCQNKYYKHSKLSPLVNLPYCRKHYNQYK